MTAEAGVRRMAEAQRGHISAIQMRSCGFTPKQIQLRRKRGELVEALPGVFRLAGVPDDLPGRLVAIDLWMDGDGFFTAETALYLLGLDGIEPPRRLSVARFSGVKGPPWLRVQRLSRSDLPARRSAKGFRIAPVERALGEACASLPPKQVGLAMNDALRKRLTTLDRLWRFADEWSGRPGAKVFRCLLRGRDDRDEKVRSEFESRMLRILRRIKEYDFVANFEVKPEGHRYFIDFYLPAPMLGVECHSFRWHMGMHNADTRRDRRIRSLGIELIYFTWDDVCYHADEAEKELRSAIARRLTEVSVRTPSQGASVERLTNCGRGRRPGSRG